MADLEAAEELPNVRVASGDALFVRVGLADREELEGREDAVVSIRAGPSPAAVKWAYDRQIAVFSGDCFDKFPSGSPEFRILLHTMGIARMGIVLLNSSAASPLAKACEEEQRFEFLVTVAPLRIPRGTSSPVKPFCVSDRALDGQAGASGIAGSS